MKALTICQPYAHLIAIGAKRVENRTWATGYRGPLAIHAGQSRSWLSDGDEQRYPDMAWGAVVAVADLAACYPIDMILDGRLPEQHEWVAQHPHTHGPECWVLDNIRRLPAPIPCFGHQGLWRLPPHVEAAVGREGNLLATDDPSDLPDPSDPVTTDH